MFLEERRHQILMWLNKHERVTVNGLAQAFSVTRETIRSDLNVLAKAGFAQRCHGGAVIVRRNLHSPLIGSSGEGVDVLLQRLELKQQQPRERNGSGKVCILGAFNVDIVARVARFPRGGESLIANGSTIGPGGKGANQALAASKAGACVHFVAKVGTDQFSQFAFDHLNSSGIHSFRLYQTAEEPTGSAIIYVSQLNGENMIAIYPGANETLTDEEIAGMASELAQSEVLLVQMENNFSATLNAIKLANKLGVRVVMNPAPYSHNVLECLAYADVITPNETEASLLSGIEIVDPGSAKAAAQAIVRLGARRVIITMGSRGALLYDGVQFQHIPALPALSVDTTGAGDAFNGAFAAALSEGKSIVQAATLACAFASMAVEREGASNMPDREQVTIRMKQR